MAQLEELTIGASVIGVVGKYAEETIQHLTSTDGMRVKVSIEVEAESDNGFNQQTVRTVSENCRTLRVRDSGFAE